MADDGSAGVAVDKDGDRVSVFKVPSSKSDTTNPEIAQENVMANGVPIATAVARSRSPLAGFFIAF